MRDALLEGIELLEPFQDSGWLGKQALDQHKQALDRLDALLEDVPKPINEPEKLKGCLAANSLYTSTEAWDAIRLLHTATQGNDDE